MSFDFDTPVERRGTDSQKWQKYAGRDVLPLWVADMDFRCAPALVEALQRRVDHGIFGYARPVASTVQAVVEGMETRYGWKIEPDWLVWLPGLVCGLNVTARAFAAEGEEILCLTPVYPPFMTGPKNQGRVSVPVGLKLEQGRWEIDWEGLERAVTPKTRIFLLCHPHNPVARVWTKDELVRLVEFCGRRKLVLCSDDIHCDLVLDPARRHLPVAILGAEAANLAVTLMAPSKTYNMPGLGTSFAVISNPKLREVFVRAAAGIVAEVTALGFAACEAAYRDGEAWRLELLAYLRGNRDFLLEFLRKELPGIRVEAPIEATYLAWLNVEALGLDRPAEYFEKHGVGLNDGTPFGDRPGRHVRINFGCTRATLAEALRRMKTAIRG